MLMSPMTARRGVRPAATLALAALALAFVPAAGADLRDRLSNTQEAGVGDAPRDMKLEALARLEQVRADVANGADGVGDRDDALDELEDALEWLEESLDPEHWASDGMGGIDPLRLDPESGAHVFNRERHTAQESFDAIEQGEITNPELETELLAIVDLLVAADRALADFAIVEADMAGGDVEELDEAFAYLARGDRLVERAAASADLDHKASLLYEAMDNAYRHAWDAAIDAVEDLSARFTTGVPAGVCCPDLVHGFGTAPRLR